MKEGADGKWAQGKKQETGEKKSARKTRGAAGVGSAEDVDWSEMIDEIIKSDQQLKLW